MEFEKSVSDKRNPPFLSKLDRFCANLRWMELFQNLEEKTLNYHESDHITIILKEVSVPKDPKPFRFQLFWLEREELLPLIESWWWDEEVEGKPGYVFSKKLKALKEKLKVWSRNNIGRL